MLCGRAFTPESSLIIAITRTLSQAEYPSNQELCRSPSGGSWAEVCILDVFSYQVCATIRRPVQVARRGAHGRTLIASSPGMQTTFVSMIRLSKTSTPSRRHRSGINVKLLESSASVLSVARMRATSAAPAEPTKIANALFVLIAPLSEPMVVPSRRSE